MAQPLCPYFGTCGGCTSQHLDYNIQLENKKNQLMHATECKDIQVFSGNPYEYRNRMDFMFHPGGLGFRKRNQWHTIVDIEKCVISNEQLNKLLTEVRMFFKGADTFDPRKHTGTFRYAVIRTPKKTSAISFVLNDASPQLHDATEKIKAFAQTTNAEHIIVTYAPPNTDISTSQEYFVIKGSDALTEEYLGKTFQYNVQGFFQNNTAMAEEMQKYVNELLKKYQTKDAHLLDLYGGVGTFGIINAELFKKVTIVESFQQCIDAANKNIEANNATNTQAIALDAQYLKRLEFQERLFVITDPPRSGMHPKTIEQLKKLQPEVIIYVSCNVQQLAKDIPKFKDYTIKSTALFDLFPQTNHSEAVVELVKRS